MTSSKRPDADILRRLDEARRTYERLRAERIRAESDVERLSRELDHARAQAKAEFGTDDEAQIEGLIQTVASDNARRVEDFATLVRDVETRLRALGTDR
jgi:hypothetical protein